MSAVRPSDRHDPMVVLDLLAATPGVPEDQLLGFGHYPWMTSFGWAAPGRFAEMISHRRREEFGCRLLTFNEPTTDRLRAEGASGKLDEADYALGILVDADSNQRRLAWPEDISWWNDGDVRTFYDGRLPQRPSEDRRPTKRPAELTPVPDEIHDGVRFYPPTIQRGLYLVAGVARPTIALDGGGGAPCVFLFDEAVPVAEVGAEWLSRLSKRLLAVFAKAVVDDGWYFDSPHPLTSWVRLPGSERARYGGHRVAVVDAAGPRYSLAEIEELAGPDDGRPLPSWGYWDESAMTEWNGTPIPRVAPPDGWGDESPSQRSNSGRGRRGRGRKRGRRS